MTNINERSQSMPRNPLSLIVDPIIDGGVHIGTPMELSWELVAAASSGADIETLEEVAARFSSAQLLVEVAALEQMLPIFHTLHRILTSRAAVEVLRLAKSGMSLSDVVAHLSSAAEMYDKQAGY